LDTDETHVEPPWAASNIGDIAETVQSAAATIRHFPVTLISTSRDQLVTVADIDRLSDVVAKLELQQFDFLPVTRKGRIQRLLRWHDLKRTRVIRSASTQRQTVWAHADPLSEMNLMSAGDPLLSFVVTADTHPCRLLIQDGRIAGIVSLSDLQKLATRPVLFALVTQVELLMAETIRRLASEAMWNECLRRTRRDKIDKKWTRLRRSRLAIDRLTATDFSDKVAVLSKLAPTLPNDTGITNELSEIAALRNSVAHAGDYALTRENARNTAKRARLAKAWIERLVTYFLALPNGLK
jgi:CBS domain-containing protein